MAKEKTEKLSFITTTLNREYLIDGVLIPKKAYSEQEKAAGKSTIVTVTADKLKKLESNTIFKNHVANGNIVILDKKPNWAKTNAEIIAEKSSELGADLQEAKEFYDKYKSENIEGLKAEVEALKATADPEITEKLKAAEALAKEHEGVVEELEKVNTALEEVQGKLVEAEAEIVSLKEKLEAINAME